jgi:hypothetical protein
MQASVGAALREGPPGGPVYQAFRQAILVAAVMVAGGTRAAYAEDLWFVSGGVGGGRVGFALLGSANVVRGRTVFGARTSTLQEFEIFGPTPVESATDAGLLVGRGSAKGSRLSYAALGIGYVHTVRRGRRLVPNGSEYERIDTRTIGIPVELRATLNASVVGMGVCLFGNLNRKDSFVGAALTVQLGTLRR